jgi:uncharacterized protein (TIGR02001 family)
VIAPAGAPPISLPGRLARLAVICAVTIGLALGASPAFAQLAGSVSAQTDYQLRGVSLTERRPAASLDLSYEFSGGAYAGVSVIAADTRPDGPQVLGHIGYLGYVIRTGPTQSIDVGVTDSVLTSYAGPIDRRLHYTDLYAAVAGEHLRLAVQYSPNYIVPHTQALYIDLSGSRPLAPDWWLFGHLGYLDAVVRQSGPAGLRSRYDWRIGVRRSFGAADLRLEWTGRSGPVATGQSRGGLVAGADFHF